MTMTLEDSQNYIQHKERKAHPHIKYIVKKGETYGFWTVINTDMVIGERKQRAALCRCVCGKEKLVRIPLLVRGKSESCGCKRHLKMSAAQKEGFQNGQKLMQTIQEENAAAGLPRALNKNSTTGYKGVSFMTQYGTYRAYITVHRKQIHLGCFHNIADAIKARKAAEEQYFKPMQEKVDAIKKKLKEKNIRR